MWEPRIECCERPPHQKQLQLEGQPKGRARGGEAISGAKVEIYGLVVLSLRGYSFVVLLSLPTSSSVALITISKTMRLDVRTRDRWNRDAHIDAKLPFPPSRLTH